MKGWRTYLPALAVIAVLGLIAGCSSDSTDPTGPGDTDTEQETLVAYMTANSLDLPTMLTSWIVGAQTVYDAGVANYFIIDIRKADKYGPGTSGPNGVDDYDDGHIQGAHSVALADIVTYEAANNTSNLPVVVVCYTGHDSGHGTMALRLMGVDAQSLKWGMSGWNSDFDLWTSHTGDTAADYPGAWATGGDPPTLPSNTEVPELSTGLTEGSAILAAQVGTLLSGGLRGITNTTVLNSPSSYHLINYWAETDWDTYGYIDGAYMVPPGDLTLETLDVLDPDGSNVVYCWSGQTASMIAAWLTVLGYDAKTLKFSANGMIYSDLLGHKWDPTTTPAELDYVASGSTEFTTLTTYLKDNDLDLPDLMGSWIIQAQDLFEAGIDNYFIIDIRTSDKYGPGTSGGNGVDDYADGHIPGAHRVLFADVVTYEAANNTGDLPVIVGCYTGHNAGHAVMALRLSGVTNSQSLGWGMSSWHSDFDLWTVNTGDPIADGLYPGAWEDTAAPALPSFSGSPTISTGETAGADILATRVEDLLDGGLRGISNSTVLADYDNYHVICYWGGTDWDDYGHITGAYQVDPGSIGVDSLDLLDPNGSNVIYCWSGQTASMLAAWMTVVGYDASTLKFSSNGMIYGDLLGHKWDPVNTPKELDYDTGL